MVHLRNSLIVRHCQHVPIKLLSQFSLQQVLQSSRGCSLASTRLKTPSSGRSAALLTQGEQWEGERGLGSLRQSTARTGEPPRRALYIGAL